MNSKVSSNNKAPCSSIREKFKRKNKLTHLAFVLPAVFLNLIFFVYPLFQSLVMSFYNWPILGEKVFIGLKNYVNLFQDQTYWNSLLFTLKYTLITTPSILIIAFLLALLINNKLPGVTLFRSIYFVPVVISMVATSLMWLWIYNDVYGVLNYILLSLNIVQEPIIWMGNASTSLPAIVFMITWKMSGFTMIILLSGLQSISEEVYEAANMDGASKWQQIRYLTIPLLKPSIALSLVVSVIGSVLAFEQFLIMTHGGPSNTTTTVVHLIYNTSFKYFNLGYGSAMTTVLLIILIVLSYFQFKVMRDPVE
jgi:multiple sugar transport system permease protein